MSESDTKGSFDRLVAGLNAEDRLAMLNRINQMNTQPVELGAEPVEPDSNITLKKKLENESVFYKFISTRIVISYIFTICVFCIIRYI